MSANEASDHSCQISGWHDNQSTCCYEIRCRICGKLLASISHEEMFYRKKENPNARLPFVFMKPEGMV